MGVGVYTNDFNGSGGTFIVDGLLGDEDGYRSYVIETTGRDAGVDFQSWKRDLAEDPSSGEAEYQDYLFNCGKSEAIDFETWHSDQVEMFESDFMEIVKIACSELVIAQVPGRRRAAFDENFLLVAENSHIQVGYRSWEHDYVLGVGGDERTVDWGGTPEDMAGEIIEETGLAPSVYGDTYANLSEKVRRYVCLSLMRDGINCSYRTSSYTTSKYEEPEEGYSEALKQLRAEIRELNTILEMSFEDGLDSGSEKERIEIARAILSCDHNTSLRAAVPIFDPERGNVKFYAPTEERIFAAAQASDAIKEEIAAIADSHDDTDDFFAIPRNDQTVGFFSEFQEKFKDYVIISADEWKAAVSSDLKIEWTDDNEDRWEAELIMSAEGAVPAP